MKRPMLVIGATYSAATWCAFLFSYRHAALLALAFGATALLFLLLKRPRLRAVPAVCLVAAAAFSAYALYYTRAILPVERLAGQIVPVEGLVTGAEIRGGSVDYTVRANFPENPGVPAGTSLMVRCYGGMPLMPGDTLRAAVQITLPRTAASQAYYRGQGIAAAGYAAGEDVTRGDSAGYAFRRFMIRLRGVMRHNLHSKLPDSSAAVLSAMVLGQSDEITPAVYSAVSRSGTAHLLAVSGLHLSILTAFLLRICGKFRFPRRLSHLTCLAGAFCFAALVGFSPSITRAFLMTATVLLGRILSRRADARNSLGFALLLICAARPWWVLSRGLWLSAASTYGILLLGGRVEEALQGRFKTGRPVCNTILRPFLSAMAVSASAYAFTLPILLVTGGWLSVLAPLSNMLVVPFVPFSILGGLLCAVLPGTALPLRILAGVTHLATQAILEISRMFAALPFCTLSLDEGWMLLWLAFAAGCMIVVLGAGRNRDLLRCAALLAVCLFSMGSISSAWMQRNAVQLATISGCDLAVLLRGKDAVVVGTPSQYEIGRLLRYLDYRGIRRVRAVVATDSAAQIGSGLLRLEREMGFDCIIGPDDVVVLAQLETAFPGSYVFSGGYADIRLLGGVLVTAGQSSGDVRLRAGSRSVLKKDAEYAMPEPYDSDTLYLYRGNTVIRPPGLRPMWEPMGAGIFGEQRFLLEL